MMIVCAIAKVATKGMDNLCDLNAHRKKNVDNGVNLLLSSLDEVQCHTISTADIERTSLAKAHVFTYRKTKQVIHC